MAKAVSQAEAIAFINEIAPHAQAAYKDLGKVLPSVCIGMACIESGYGTSNIMRKHCAFMGQKVGSGRTAKKYWSGKFFVAKTSEEYTVGVHTIIKDAFRAYDNTRQCIYNYYELLNTSLYSRVKADANYSTQMAQIKTCGYMTSSTEVDSVIKVINRYNLTRFDTKLDKPSTILPILRKGDRNDYVKAWQTFLNGAGYPCGKIDGIFGKKTEAAVKAWQSDHGLVPDGIIGPKTWGSLPN